MQFTKMHGCGNDFVLVDCRASDIDDGEALAREVLSRHTGVGGDGLILLQNSDRAVVRMKIHNADGSHARMCGNGIRCVAKYVFDRRWCTDPMIPIDTDAGVKTARVTVTNGKVDQVQIDMGRPEFNVSGLFADIAICEWIDKSVTVRDQSFLMNVVSMGNPHAVFFVDQLDHIDVSTLGPLVERHSVFSRRVNAHFVVVETRARVKVITWERGCGATMACGTGAAAVCAAGARTGRTGRSVTAALPGGALFLEWSRDDRVYMTGSAVEVFEGRWSCIEEAQHSEIQRSETVGRKLDTRVDA